MSSADGYRREKISFAFPDIRVVTETLGELPVIL